MSWIPVQECRILVGTNALLINPQLRAKVYPLHWNNSYFPDLKTLFLFEDTKIPIESAQKVNTPALRKAPEPKPKDKLVNFLKKLNKRIRKR